MYNIYIYIYQSMVLCMYMLYARISSIFSLSLYIYFWPGQCRSCLSAAVTDHIILLWFRRLLVSWPIPNASQPLITRITRGPSHRQPQLCTQQVNMIFIAKLAPGLLFMAGLRKESSWKNQCCFVVWTGGWPTVQFLRSLFVQRCRNVSATFQGWSGPGP